MTDEKLPNFGAVTLKEAIEYAGALAMRDGETLGEWVARVNAERAQAQIDYESQPVTIGDVTLMPGDCANLSIKRGYSGAATTRKINCTITGQAVARTSYSATRMRMLRFVHWGASAGAYVRDNPNSVAFSSVVAAEKVETPAWIITKQAEQKERGW